MSTPNAPWLLWGGESNVQRVIPSAVTAPTVIAQQLVNIEYKRPESWSFYLSGSARQIVAGGFDPPLLVHFDLILGVGRTTDTIVDFCVFRWNLETAAGLRWTTVVPAPLFDPVSPSTFVAPVDTLPAQSIMLNARVVPNQVGINYDLDLTLKAFFAPKTHVRPEWLGTAAGTRSAGSGIPRFPGGEDTGH